MYATREELERVVKLARAKARERLAKQPQPSRSPPQKPVS
jgi:hypothetical protein